MTMWGLFEECKAGLTLEKSIIVIYYINKSKKEKSYQ